jgi:hypothetical protein
MQSLVEQLHDLEDLRGMIVEYSEKSIPAHVRCVINISLKKLYLSLRFLCLMVSGSTFSYQAQSN